jgi:transcriptional regulator with GAF, ATPase, and Fis domain
LARHIHQRSPRRRKRFVDVNCGSIAPHLFESEFFGHVKGAFTGAWRDRSGRFQFADGGTLFLDEVAEIPLELQSRFLTVLQTGVFERVGEDESRKVDVRIIAATNRDLPKMVSEGRFREDLYYRLNAFPLELPLLRERIEDIPLLAAHFLEKLCSRYGCAVPELDEDHCRFLLGLKWEGNIRELEHRLERALILSNGGRLKFQDSSPERPAGPDVILRHDPEAFLRENDLRRIECENLHRVLTLARGKVYGKGGAAELLGVPPTTVMSRLKNFGLDREVRRSLVEEPVGSKG